MQSLKNKVAIITGASSGIGAATALALAREGVKVTLVARRKDRLGNHKKVIIDEGGEAIIVQADVTSCSDWQTVAKRTNKKWGKVDILINNAGVMLLSFMNKLKVDEWSQMIDINVKGVLFGIAEVLPYMREQKSGHIINISSDAGIKVFPGSAVYSGTKAAVNWISEGLRAELARDKAGIRVSTISPGAVATALASHITDMDVFEVFKTFPQIKFMDPEDIAAAVVYALTQPPHVDINNILVRPTEQVT